MSHRPVAAQHGGERAWSIPTREQIQLPIRSAVHRSAAHYATWAHAGVHSMGHSTRLDLELGEARWAVVMVVHEGEDEDGYCVTESTVVNRSA